MFVRKSLIKKINETYFRNYTSFKELFQIDEKNYEEDIQNLIINLSELEHMRDFNFSKGVNSYVELIQDLIDELQGKTDFRTEFAKDIQATRTVYSTRVLRSIPTEGVVSEVISILSNLSKESALVGGSVRDSILGHNPKDFDFVTDTNYDTLVENFKKNGFNIKETGKNFLVLIVSKEGEDFEIANFRKDGTYEDGRRPESVDIGNIYDDAERRDFTVNALYFRLHDSHLSDPIGQGILDIKEKILRFVGKPKDRLQEDALRIFRFYRFLAKGFKPASKDLKAVRTLFKDSYSKTDPERARIEIEKMLNL